MQEISQASVKERRALAGIRIRIDHGPENEADELPIGND
jgi:hypothetical protein